MPQNMARLEEKVDALTELVAKISAQLTYKIPQNGVIFER